MDEQGLYQPVPAGTKRLKKLQRTVREQLLPHVHGLLNYAVIAAGIYWLFRFSSFRVQRGTLPESWMAKGYELDYGSGIAYLCFGALLAILLSLGLVYLTRYVWNICESWMQKWVPLSLVPIARTSAVLLILLASMREIPRIKTYAYGHYSHVSVLIASVTYKSQTRAQNFGDFVDFVKTDLLN